MKLTKEEQIQANADKKLALWRKYRESIFKEYGHVPLSPFKKYEDSLNSIICSCGETLCPENKVINVTMEKMLEAKKHIKEILDNKNIINELK